MVLAASDSRADAIVDVLKGKLVRRQLSLKILDAGKPEPAAKGNVRQVIQLRKGIAEETARDLTKRIKANHSKVQVRIQGDELRVTSKDKDALQAVIKELRELDLPVPLQYTNYR